MFSSRLPVRTPTAPTVTAAIAVLAATLLLSGCAVPRQMGQEGMGMDPGTSTSADSNRADMMFVQMMIPHHEQAIEMSDLLSGKSGISAGSMDLAQEITAAQTAEIAQMKSLLDDWGVNSMGDMGDTGMMSGDDMEALADAEGTDAERIFLTGMIDHHEGAIDMAEPEVENGESAETVALATDIIRAQRIEIELMKDLLAALPSE